MVAADHVYLRHLSAEYWLILSADMSTDSRPIYQPILGGYDDGGIGVLFSVFLLKWQPSHTYRLRERRVQRLCACVDRARTWLKLPPFRMQLEVSISTE